MLFQDFENRIRQICLIAELDMVTATDHDGQANAPQGQAEAILRMRSRSSLPEAPHPFLPGGISGLNFSYRA